MTVPRRRDVLRGLAAAGLGAAAGVAGGWAVAEARPFESPQSDDSDGGTATATGTGPVDPHGPYQAGIARPTTPQSHGVMAVLDLAVTAPALAGASDFVAGLQTLCAQLGEAITALTSTGGSSGLDSPGAELLDGPGDLTVTVGIGPRLVRAVDPSLPGADELPRFASDEGLTADRIGGDILLATYSSNPNDADHAIRWLASRVPGASLRWSQRLFRGPGKGTVTRNPLGFHDGVIVPHGDAELDQHVWIPDGPLAGGTICVVRRLRLDSSGFHGESHARQEAIIGRRRHDGAPLSGGERDDEVDLLAKSPDGQYVVPARSHVRGAHPSFTGSALMLRRGYAFDDGALGDDPNIRDAGLMFTCFQRELRTFVQTQHRLDETDDLMGYATPTASATFLILPGFAPDRPLGSALG